MYHDITKKANKTVVQHLLPAYHAHTVKDRSLLIIGKSLHSIHGLLEKAKKIPVPDRNGNTYNMRFLPERL